MQLAEKLGVTNKTISKWENGKDVDKDCTGSNDSAQIVDLLKRTQELEQHTHILYAILLIFMGIVMWRQIMIKVEEN